jgi:hypothetical protein
MQNVCDVPNEMKRALLGPTIANALLTKEAGAYHRGPAKVSRSRNNCEYGHQYLINFGY